MKNPASLLLLALPLTLTCGGDENSGAKGGTAGAGGTPGMSGAGGSIFSADPPLVLDGDWASLTTD